MILIGTIDNPRAAQALVDYLHHQGIDCRLQPGDVAWELWLSNEEHYSQAKQEFDAFIANPNQSKYLDVSWQTSRPQLKLEYGDSSVGLLQNFLVHAGPLTLGILTICVVVFIAANLGFGGTYNLLAYFPAHQPEYLWQGWRLFTPALLHFSAMHLVFNLLWWWYLGGQIEQKLGLGKLLSILLIASAIPNLVQFMMSGPLFGGLSGVVYALIGYFWWMGRLNPGAGIHLPNAYVGFMLVWLVIGWFDVLGIKTANGAHLAGLAVGCLMAWLDARRR